MPIAMYVVVFHMDGHDSYHTVVRPFAYSLKDKKGLVAEELGIPKKYVKSVKLCTVPPVKIDTDLRLGNLLFKNRKYDVKEE